MPLRPSPTFRVVNDSMLEIADAGMGGLNLKDLEFEQKENQSPFMKNMMYRNGAFSKRYGQKVELTFPDDIHCFIRYKGSTIVHSNTTIYKNTSDTVIATGIANQKGMFVLFNQLLYYFCGSIYQYDGTTWKTVEPYIPTTVINMHPDGTGGDPIEPYNMIGMGFTNEFHGDNTSTEFHLYDKELDEIEPKVLVDNEEWTHDETLSSPKTFKINYSTGVVTLKSAAPNGTNNVEITAYKHDDEWTSYHDQILGSKYYANFGGNNNSRLFVAGGGKSMYYYSEVYDASYFPYTNYAKVGNSAEDVTGFGQQYNVLIVFKPTEIFSLTYYQQSDSTTTDESEFGLGAFASQVVNSSIGCDCPDTIQLVNNQLTWLSTREGVCTLVSTNIIDERNVRTISRNIDRTNNVDIYGHTIEGILDWEDREGIVSADYDGKYFLANRTTGQCYMWDYAISPYISGTRVTNPKDIAWFYFDNFYVKQFLEIGDELHYIPSHEDFSNCTVKLDESFDDLDFDNDGHPDGIDSFYMTPFLQFGAVEYLKTIKNLYIQCRGDTASKIDVYYYTDESSEPIEDSEPIIIGGRMWQQFDWPTFDWYIVNWANTYRRKCSLKKIQMASFFFKNNEVGRDMSITHISLQYQIVKYIK